MIERYVRMTFKPEEKENFLLVFEANKQAIASFPGVRHLELRYSEHEPCVFSTFSTWNSVEDLQAYRKSELFAGVWKQVKPMFSGPVVTRTVDRESGLEMDV